MYLFLPARGSPPLTLINHHLRRPIRLHHQTPPSFDCILPTITPNSPYVVFCSSFFIFYVSFLSFVALALTHARGICCQRDLILTS